MTSKILDIKQLKFKHLVAKDVSTDITWLYKLMGEKKPKIYFAESYGAQKKQVKKYAKSDSMEPMYNDKVRNRSLENGIHENQIESLRKQYGNTQTNTRLDKVTEVLVKNVKGSDSEQYFGGAFEMFYSLDEKTNARIYKLYEKGIFDIEFYKEQCFICMNPVAMRFDSENRLSGKEKPAIEFNDGDDMYFARDVFFDAKTWKKITSKKMPIAEILTLPNVEQRSVAIEFMGAEVLLDCKEAKIVHGPTKRGNTLYDLELQMGAKNNWNDGGKYTYKLLRYGCPSTERQYASFVPEDITDADSAMAWKFQITKEAYLKDLKIET